MLNNWFFKKKKKALIYSVCWFPWCKYSYHVISSNPHVVTRRGLRKRWLQLALMSWLQHAIRCAPNSIKTPMYIIWIKPHRSVWDQWYCYLFLEAKKLRFREVNCFPQSHTSNKQQSPDSTTWLVAAWHWTDHCLSVRRFPSLSVGLTELSSYPCETHMERSIWPSWIDGIHQHFMCCVLYCDKLLLSCLTLCDPMDCSPPGSSVHGILQARILERVALPSSRGSAQLRDQITITSLTSPALAGKCFTTSTTWDVQHFLHLLNKYLLDNSVY